MVEHYITLDTCTWIYIVNGTEPVSHLLFIRNELEKGNIRLILPEMVITEWDKHKNDTVKKGTLKFFKETLTSLKRLSKLIGEKSDDPFWSFSTENETKGKSFKDLVDGFQQKKKQIEDAVLENIEIVEGIFKHKNTMVIKESDEIKLQASELALLKKAPFLKKNSFADAIILLCFISYVKKHNIFGAKFISYNTEDFCLKNNGKTTLHPELIPFFEDTKSEFYKIVGEVLNTIEKNIVSEETLQLIQARQQDFFDDDYDCEECDGNRDGYGNIVSYWYETNIINEYDESHENHKYTTAIAGNCEWCNSLHIKCPKCNSITPLSEYRFDEEVECEGGCGIIFYVESDPSHHNIGDYEIKIIDHRIEECSTCGEGFIDDGGQTGMCKKCNEEFGTEK